MKKIQRSFFFLSVLILMTFLAPAQPQLVGSLRFGGPQIGGAIFRIDVPGTSPGVVHPFNNLNPHRPVGGVCAGDEDWFYGTLTYNGTNNEGAGYRIKKDGTGYVKLFDFGTNSVARGTPFYHTDGKVYYNAENKLKVFDPATMGVTDVTLMSFSYSKELLIDANDYVYCFGFGEQLVRQKTDGSDWSQLHQFNSATEGSSGDIGVTEVPGDIIFGVMKFGGTNNGGTLYSINKDGTNFTVHHQFINATGEFPESKLVLFDGRLFGTTSRGGSFDNGVLYTINLDGTGYRVLTSIDPGLGSGSEPMGNIQIAADGRVYGCYSQFNTNSSFTANRLWKVDSSGTNLEPFYNLRQREHGHWNIDILLTNDSIFLSTQEQGRHDGGVLSMTDTFGFGGAALHHFGESTNGFYPESGFIKGSDGRLYGTTSIGGADGNGIVYSVNATGAGFTKLHEFTDAEGYNPAGKLLEGSDGKIYGVCNIGGPTNTGCIYRMDKNGANFQVIYNFSDFEGGYFPVGDLVEGSGGVLYGMVMQGNNGSGVFRVNLNGTGYTLLKNFTQASIYGPQSGLALYRGYLYGFTLFGGVAGRGGIFRIRTDGTGYQLMHEFTSTEGQFPWAPPTIANNGRVYGTAQMGGTNFYGNLFSIDTSGAGFTVLRDFDFATDGAYPNGQLVQGSDGLLYGATQSSGLMPGGGGTIFRMNLDGSGFTTLKEFNNTTEGSGAGTLLDLTATPLPVQWVDFTAKQKAQTVLLKWQTAQEQNADKFIIERSGTGVAFQTIGAVTATGNTPVGSRYSFTDADPLPGDNYYRLKQTDKDGKFTFSKIARVHFERRTIITLSPNPVLDNLTIRIPAGEPIQSVDITDASGRLMMRKAAFNSSVAIISCSTLSKGIYWVKVQTARNNYQLNFMKQ